MLGRTFVEKNMNRRASGVAGSAGRFPPGGPGVGNKTFTIRTRFGSLDDLRRGMRLLAREDGTLSVAPPTVPLQPGERLSIAFTTSDGTASLARIGIVERSVTPDAVSGAQAQLILRMLPDEGVAESVPVEDPEPQSFSEGSRNLFVGLNTNMIDLFVDASLEEGEATRPPPASPHLRLAVIAALSMAAGAGLFLLAARLWVSAPPPPVLASTPRPHSRARGQAPPLPATSAPATPPPPPAASAPPAALPSKAPAELPASPASADAKVARGPATPPVPPALCPVRVKSQPSGAVVRLAGHRLGVTPTATLAIPCGASLEVERAQYELATINVTEDPGRSEIMVELTRPGALLEVTSEPPDAEVRLAGHLVGHTPALLPVPQFRAIQIELRAPGYARWTKTLTLHDRGFAVRARMRGGKSGSRTRQ